MGELVQRRLVLASIAASFLSSCSRGAFAVQFSVDANAVALVQDLVRSFAAEHDYKSVEVVDPSRGLYYEGRWSSFSFYQMDAGDFAGDFMAELYHKAEILFPRDDLEAWLEELRTSLRQIEGVQFAQGYE